MELPIPDATVSVKLSYIITFLILITSVGIIWGQHVAGDRIQADQIKSQQQTIDGIRNDMQQMHEDIARLTQSIEDLRETLNKK